MASLLDGLTNALNKVIDRTLQNEDNTNTTQPDTQATPAASNQDDTTTNTDIVPATNTTPVAQGEAVQGTFIDASLPQQSMSNAAAQTREFQKVVNSFDEDKQGVLASLTEKLYTLLAYTVPPIAAYGVGAAIGDAFSGPFTLSSSYSVSMHVISVGLELLLPALGFAVVTQFKRALKERSQMPMFIILGVLFLVLGVGNSFAQLFLINQHVSTGDSLPAQIGVYFRAFGPMIIDVISTMYLSVVGVRNLKKYLADQRVKIEAVKDVNAINIELDQAHLKAAMDKQNAIMEMHSKAQRATTWNEIEAMQSKAMIEQAKRNMGQDGEGGSYRRSRY